MNILQKKYMLKPNGNFYNTVSFLRGSCYWINIYLILKNKYPGLCNITNYFLDDYPIELLLKDNLDIVYLGTNSINRSKNVNKGLIINKHEYLKQGTSAINALEKHLSQDGYIIVETINELLPFSIHYGDKFDINNYEFNHLILFIYFDNTYFYYVDDPIMLNHRALLHKNGIYKIEKEELLDAIGQYINCYIVETTNTISSSLGEKNLTILKESIKNFYLPIKTLNNITVYPGYEAINKLLYLSKVGYIVSSDHKNVSKHTDVFLSNAFHIIRGNRYIYLQYLISDFDAIKNSNKRKLIDLFQQEISNWSHIWNMAEKDMLKDQKNGAFILDVRFSKYFSRILELEEQIINEFKNNLPENY